MPNPKEMHLGDQKRNICWYSRNETVQYISLTHRCRDRPRITAAEALIVNQLVQAALLWKAPSMTLTDATQLACVAAHQVCLCPS